MLAGTKSTTSAGAIGSVRVDVQITAAPDPGDAARAPWVARRFAAYAAVHPGLESVALFRRESGDPAVLQGQFDRLGVGAEQQAGPVGIEIPGQILGLAEQVVTQPAHLNQEWPQQASPLTPAEPVYLGVEMVDHAFPLFRPGVITLYRGSESFHVPGDRDQERRGLLRRVRGGGLIGGGLSGGGLSNVPGDLPSAGASGAKSMPSGSEIMPPASRPRTSSRQHCATAVPAPRPS